jgi:hypothetical protein
MGKNERCGGDQVQVQVRGADEVALVYVYINHTKMHRKSASLYMMLRTTKYGVVHLYPFNKIIRGVGVTIFSPLFHTHGPKNDFSKLGFTFWTQPDTKHRAIHLST